jgi:hypothetical protein
LTCSIEKKDFSAHRRSDGEAPVARLARIAEPADRLDR